MDAIQERLELINKIVRGRITQDEVKKEIVRLNKKYGENAFVNQEIEKKKTWNRKYYEHLINLGTAGMGSEEYIMHLVEVRDSLKCRKICGFLAAVLFVVILTIIIILVLGE